MLGNESTVRLQPSQVLMLLDVIEELEASASATGQEILAEPPHPVA